MHIIFPIVGLFLVGFAARRFIPNPSLVVKWVNYFIIYISLPAIILLKVPQLEFTPQVIIPAAAAWAWLILGAVITLLFCRFLSLPKPTEGAMLLLVTMGNTSFLGYPMVSAFLGDAALAYAIFFDQLGGFLILSTYGFIIVALYTPQVLAEGSLVDASETPSIKVSDVIKRIFTFPPFITLMVSFFLPVKELVAIIEPALSLIASMLMPAALFVLGVQFQPKLLPEHKLPLCVGITLKMVMAPALALLVVTFLDGSELVRNATVFEAAMPSMITPGLMAIGAGIAPRFVATMLGYCTIVGFVTLPIIAFYLTL